VRLELISIPTETRPLDGLLYRPDADSAVQGGVLLMHGNTNNFYTGPSRFLPPRLVELGLVCLAFNRRGHDILTTLEGKRAGGGAFQTAAESRADNEHARDFLAGLGIPEPIVVGHSNGGMLGADFAARHPETRALVLLSAHAGGSGTYVRACAEGRLAGDAATSYLDRARRLVADDRGDELLLLPGWWFAISAASLVDRHEHTPDLLDNAARIHCPSLFVVGDREPAETYPAREFSRRAAGPSQAHVLADGDHWYTGQRETVAGLVTDWLAATVLRTSASRERSQVTEMCANPCRPGR
jgi:pimeloyl-ACP methyl ester carboxylesterase